jgi:hypothetical protein
MTKIKITLEQYNKIIAHEKDTRLLKESENSDFQNTNDVLLGFAKIIGANLTGQNEFIANEALKNKSIMLKIKNIIIDVNEREKMIDDLSKKGLKDANDKIVKSLDKIVSNYNKYANQNKIEDKLNVGEVINKVLKK